MLTNPKPGTIAALVRLARSPDGVEFLKYLDSELEDMKNAMIDAQDGPRYLRFQGRARFAKDLIELLRGSEKILEKQAR